MADFEAKVRAVLDPSSLTTLKSSIETGIKGQQINISNFYVDASKIRSQVEKELKKSFDITINVSGSGASAGKNFVTDFTANLNRSLVSGVNIGNTETALQAIGLDQNSIDRATKNLAKSLQEVEYKIKSIRSVEKIDKDGKAAGGRISIDAYDKLGNLVNVVQGINLDGTLGAQTRSVLQSFEQGAQAAKYTIEDLNNTLQSTGNFNAFTSILTDFDKLETGSTELVTSVTNLKNAFATMNNTSLSDDDRLAALEKYNDALKESKRLIADTVKQNASAIKSDTLSNNVKTAIANTQDWLNKNPRAAAAYGAEIDAIIQKLKDPALDRNTFQNLTSQLNAYKAAAKEAGLTTSPLVQNLKQLFGVGSTLAIMQKGLQTVKQMAQETIKVDTAMTELYRVTDLSATQYSKLYDNMVQSAKSYGAELNTMINATASWVRLGFDANTANKLAEVSTMYQHVTDLDEKTAVNNLVTAYMGFKESLLEVSDGDEVAAITRISDVFDALGNKLPVTAANVATGIEKNASVLQSMGASLEQAAAMVVASGSVSQDFAKSGTALKIFALRITGAKGQLEELGEEVDENVVSVTKMQTQILNLTKGKVNIFEEDGKTFRNIYEIAKDLAEVLPTLDGKDQAELLETVAGKSRSNDILNLLRNFNMAEKALSVAEGSAGTAAAENAIYMDSLQGRIDSLKASWQALSADFVQSDFLKVLVSGATGFLNVLDAIISKFGTFNTLLTGGAIFGAVKAFKSIS